MLLSPDIILLIFSILQFTITGVILLLSKEGNNQSNRFLSFFLLAKAFCFSFEIAGKMSATGVVFGYFTLNSLSFDLLLGPLLYFYVKKSTFNEIKYDKYFLLNFLPFILLLSGNNINFLIQLLLPGQSGNIFSIISVYSFFRLAEILVYSHFVIYSLLSLKLLSEYKNYLTGNFSQAHLSLLKWLKMLVGGFIFIWVMNIANIFLGLNREQREVVFFITILGIFLFANVIVIFALRKPEIFQNKILPVKKKYEKTLLSDSEREEYLTRLLRLMNEEKMYLSNTLSLSDLAEKMKVQTHIVSQVINSEFGKNFYDFINSYRVEECKKLFSKDSNNTKTILEIAFECGFNSKSVFNDSFKKITGETPTAFRKKISAKK